MATFFFWRAGNLDQKSIHGLLRSLLYQLLETYPRLGKQLASSVYEARREWTVKRLKATLRTVIERCEVENLKICLLLDGLDEFEGDGIEQAPLVDLIQDLVKNSRIKAVVSSRPEPLFVERLSKYESLRLQDLNYEDIRQYVEGRLLQEPLMLKYRVSNVFSTYFRLYEFGYTTNRIVSGSLAVS